MIYVVTAIPGKELEAAAGLRKLGYEAYVPRALRRFRKGNDHYFTAEIMFAGYAFIFLSEAPAAKDHYAVLSVRYVGMLPFTNRCLSRKEEEYIKLLCNYGHPCGISAGYIKDGRLHITSGFLKHYEDRIIKYSVRQHKATIAVPVYGETHRITFTVDIEKV